MTSVFKYTYSDIYNNTKIISYLVFLEQHANASSQSFYCFDFIVHHTFEVIWQVAHFNTPVLKVMFCHMVQVGVMEEGFWRDAANIQTSASKRFIFFYWYYLQAEN